MPLALGMTQLEHSAFDLGDTLPTLRGVGVTQLEHCALKLGDTLVPLALGMTHNVRVVPSGKYLPREELPTGKSYHVSIICILTLLAKRQLWKNLVFVFGQKYCKAEKRQMQERVPNYHFFSQFFNFFAIKH